MTNPLLQLRLWTKDESIALPFAYSKQSIAEMNHGYPILCPSDATIEQLSLLLQDLFHQENIPFPEQASFLFYLSESERIDVQLSDHLTEIRTTEHIWWIEYKLFQPKVKTFQGPSETWFSCLAKRNQNENEILVGAYNGTVQSFSIENETRETSSSLSVMRGMIQSITALNDDFYVTASQSGHVSLLNWSHENQVKRLATFQASTDSIVAMTFTGSLLITAGWDSNMKLWQIPKQWMKRKQEPSPSKKQAIALDTLTAKHVFEKAHQGPITGLGYFESNQQLFSCSFDGTVQQTDLNNLKLLSCFKEKRGLGAAQCMATLESMHSRFATGYCHGRALLWDTLSASTTHVLDSKQPGIVSAMCWLNEQQLVTGVTSIDTHQEQVVAWDCRATRSPLWTWHRPKGGAVRAMTICGRNDLVVVGKGGIVDVCKL